MPKLREIRNCLLLFHDQKLIDDEEFILLYDLNRSKNPDFPYWRYDRFDLDRLSDDECKGELRFLKNDLYNFQKILGIPEEIKCYNRLVVDGIETLCILLKRFAYPIRYNDMIPRFGRPVPCYDSYLSRTWPSFHNLYATLAFSCQFIKLC